MPGIVLMPDTAGEMDATSVLLAILWTSHGFVSILHHRPSFCYYSNFRECLVLAIAGEGDATSVHGAIL